MQLQRHLALAVCEQRVRAVGIEDQQIMYPEAHRAHGGDGHCREPKPVLILGNEGAVVTDLPDGHDDELLAVRQAHADLDMLGFPVEAAIEHARGDAFAGGDTGYEF